jgi:RNA polymerase sigma factor (sigma-70 family)
MMTETQELLARFVRDGSEPAFRELVCRYVDLVYSTAIRLVEGDAHRAQDVAQVVFADLARMAGKLSAGTTLGGWLHRHTCFVARTVMRGERRRLARERQAVEMNALNDQTESVLARIAPILDEAIQELGVDDRDVILLRFFERRNLRSVGEALGTSENVAQKRVARAVQELGLLLRRRGVALSAAALAGGLAAGAVTAAPAGLGLSIAATVVGGAGAAGGAGLASAKVAVLAKVKVGIVVGLVVAGVATLFVQQRSKARVPEVNSPAAPQPVQAVSGGSQDPDPVSPEVPVPVPQTQAREPRVAAPQILKPVADVPALPARPIAPVPAQVVAETPALPYQRFAARSGSKVRIEGTSNVGNWQVESTVIGGSLEVGPGFPLEPGQTSSPGPVPARAEAFILVRSLRSLTADGRLYSDKMDQIMYESLRVRQNPRIYFRLLEMSLTGATNYNDVLWYEFESHGELAVAGVTNPIAMPVFAAPLGNGKLKISGGLSVRMSSFQIDPASPALAFGAVKPGDEVRLLFEWVVGATGNASVVPQTGLVPLSLDLPAPAFKTLPKDMKLGPNVERLSDQPRPPLMVPPGLTNLAPGSKLTCSDTNVSADTLAKVTDGDKEAYDQSIIFLRKGTQWVQMDLGRPQQIFALVIWHAHNLPKAYHDVIVQASDNPRFTQDVATLFNNDSDGSSKLGVGKDREYCETHEGKLIDAKGIKARYLRFYSKGSTESALNEYTEIEVYGRPAR